MSTENPDQPSSSEPLAVAQPEASTNVPVQVELVPAAQPELPSPAQAWPGEILARLDSLELELRGQTERFQAGLSTLTEKVAFIPPQIRNLGAKVDAVAAVAADSKYRSLLLTLLALHDLAGQMRLGEAIGEGQGALRRPLEVIFTQIQQILESNGLKEIPASGPFDPALHCAIQVAPTEDPALDGKIARLVRSGFTLAGRTLRFAEVEIWKLQPRPVTLADASPEAGAVLEAASPAAEPSERLAF
jgi:molecular chaperone GrpE